MFLSVLILLQSSMPCSENFNRYKRNYEKYLTSNPDSKDKPRTEVEVRMIASPRLMSKLAPVNQMNLAGGGDDLNFNPNSQKVLLQLAANKKSEMTNENNSADETGGEGTKEIPIAQFKSNKLSMIDKKQRAEELEKMVKDGSDKIDASDAVRLPNAVPKGQKMTLSIDPNTATQ